MVKSEIEDRSITATQAMQSFTIISERQSALQALAEPADKPGQEVVHRTLDLAKKLKDRQDSAYSGSPVIVATLGTKPLTH